MKLLLVSIAFCLPFSASWAVFPEKVTVHFKDKMCCRDVRKLLRKNHLYVSCQPHSSHSREYSADYLGRQPIKNVISNLAENEKVQSVASPEKASEE